MDKTITRNQRAMTGVRSEYKDSNGGPIYSGQKLAKPGELLA